jgi:hypothetical protein
MKMQKTRNTFFGLLIIGLLAGIAQDALAQRTVLRSERRSDKKRSARTMLQKDKIVKQSGKQTVRKNRTSKSVRSKAMYSKNENRKKVYRDSKKEGRSYKRDGRQAYTDRDSKKDKRSYKKDRKHAYKHRDKKRHYPTKKTWHRSHYRKPVWVDYHRPGYRYPRIGMRASVLPHGFISFRIGKLGFYVYRGVYYSYDPALRVYVVVNKPRIEFWYTSVTWDRITLVDGSTIEGVYRYSDNNMVIFEVGDALLEIPMSEIKILSLSEN